MSGEADIVKRLRSLYRFNPIDPPPPKGYGLEVLLEAADLIESLRENLALAQLIVRAAVDAAQPVWSGELRSLRSQLAEFDGDVPAISEARFQPFGEP